MKLDVGKVKKRLTFFVVYVSMLMFTFIMTLNYSVDIHYEGYTAESYQVRLRNVALAVAIMIPLYVAFLKKTDAINLALCSAKKSWIVIAAICAGIISVQLLLDTRKNYSHIIDALTNKVGVIEPFLTKLCLAAMCAGSIFAVFIIVLHLFCHLIPFGHEYLEEMDSFEKGYFVIVLPLCISVISYFYARTNAPWNSLDLVYQTDSVFLMEHYYPVFGFGYDFDWDIGCGGIRHPLATFLTYPIYIIVAFISNILYFVPNITPFLYATMQSILLILIGITIKRLTNSIWAAVIFAVSFPFSFFTIFIEKYQLSVFLMVMFLYAAVKKKEKFLQKYFLISAGGMMLTSVVCGFFYGTEKKIWPRIKEYIEVGVSFFVVLIATGRIGYILNFFYLKNQNYTMFFNGGIEELSIFNRLAGFSNLLTSTFIPVPYGGNEINFYWTDLTSKINIVGLLIALFVVMSVVLNRKKSVTWAFLLFIGYSLFQEVVLGIGPGCDPLFNLYFMWPTLALTIMGIEKLIKSKFARIIVYIPIVLVIAYLNVKHLSDLLAYLVSVSPT